MNTPMVTQMPATVANTDVAASVMSVTVLPVAACTEPAATNTAPPKRTVVSFFITLLLSYTTNPASSRRLLHPATIVTPV